MKYLLHCTSRLFGAQSQCDLHELCDLFEQWAKEICSSALQHVIWRWWGVLHGALVMYLSRCVFWFSVSGVRCLHLHVVTWLPLRFHLAFSEVLLRSQGAWTGTAWSAFVGLETRGLTSRFFIFDPLYRIVSTLLWRWKVHIAGASRDSLSLASVLARRTLALFCIVSTWWVFNECRYCMKRFARFKKKMKRYQSLYEKLPWQICALCLLQVKLQEIKGLNGGFQLLNLMSSEECQVTWHDSVGLSPVLHVLGWWCWWCFHCELGWNGFHALKPPLVRLWFDGFFQSRRNQKMSDTNQFALKWKDVSANELRKAFVRVLEDLGFHTDAASWRCTHSWHSES